MTEDRDFSEYEFDPDITTYEGFTIGDQIFCTEDSNEELYLNGDEGVVVGFSVIPPAGDPSLARAFGNDPNGRTAIYVLMDGTEEPIEVRPEHMEEA